MQTESLLEKLFNAQSLTQAESHFFFDQVIQGKLYKKKGQKRR